jgi:hypothetical protein
MLALMMDEGTFASVYLVGEATGTILRRRTIRQAYSRSSDPIRKVPIRLRFATRDMIPAEKRSVARNHVEMIESK